MELIPQYNDFALFLVPSEIIDFDHPMHDIGNLAERIAAYSQGETDYIKNAYEYVRDEISHSADIEGKVVTCKASEVLRAKEGICFAKSHLLAALLRYKSIPAGFCYQRLILDDEAAPYLILHGLNAVYVKEHRKWIRLDTRGNKAGVDAQFSLDAEKLAFSVRSSKGEEDILVIFATPDQNVIAALTDNKTFDSLWANLPTELDRE